MNKDKIEDLLVEVIKHLESMSTKLDLHLEEYQTTKRDVRGLITFKHRVLAVSAFLVGAPSVIYATIQIMEALR